MSTSDHPSTGKAAAEPETNPQPPPSRGTGKKQLPRTVSKPNLRQPDLRQPTLPPRGLLATNVIGAPFPTLSPKSLGGSSDGQQGPMDANLGGWQSAMTNSQMHLKVFGTRGSYPVCRPNVVRYGGNTTCLCLESGEDLIVIDGGSGITQLGDRLCERYPNGRTIHLFLTHPHWDHVLGLPFFRPFYVPGFTIVIHGADSENKALESVLATQHKPASFPVSFEHLGAELKFDRLGSNALVELQSTLVRTIQLNHPGVNLGYRFDGPGASFAILTDLAPIEGNILGAGMKESGPSEKVVEERYQSDLVEFVKGTDLVYHDTNFTDDEIVGKEHWGHSTPTHGLNLVSHHHAPPALVLSHHDPNHGDLMMDEIYESARKDGKERGVEVLIAKEGGVFHL